MYALSYTALIHPNIAWVPQSIGLFGFLNWVRDHPKHWYLIHLLSFMSLYWLVYPLHYFVRLPWLTSLPLIAIFILILSAIKSLPMMLLSKWNARKGMICSALYWAIFEYIQTFFMQFPWVLWSQLQGSSPLLYFLSPFPCSLWIALVIILWDQLTYSSRYIQTLYIISILCIGLLNYSPSTQPSLRIGLVQGNIDKVTNSRESYTYRYWLHDAFIQQYIDLTNQLRDVDLVIWPECIVGSIYPKKLSDLSSYIQHLNFSSPLLLGASFIDHGHQNVSILLFPTKDLILRSKMHYVPFAESTPVPFISLLKKIIPDFHFESLHTPDKYDIFTFFVREKLYSMLSIICYESAFLSYETIPKVDMIVIQSENIWFHSTTAQHQQIAFAQLIARKHKTPVIVVSNNGITGWINSNGILQNIIPINTNTTMIVDWVKQ